MSLTSVPPGSPLPDDSGSLSKPDDHGGIGPPSAEAVRLGYEPDRYDTKSVVSVPILVILFFVLAFGTTTVVFMLMSKPGADPSANPLAVERNQANINERLTRTNRGSHDVDQPRLEPLRARKGDPRAITSSQELDGNPPYLHPEDNRADAARTPELFRMGWVDPAKKDTARVAISAVMDAPDKVTIAAGKPLFPTSKNGTRPPASDHTPSAANAGRGAENATSTPPKLPPALEGKK